MFYTFNLKMRYEIKIAYFLVKKKLYELMPNTPKWQGIFILNDDASFYLINKQNNRNWCDCRPFDGIEIQNFAR